MSTTLKKEFVFDMDFINKEYRKSAIRIAMSVTNDYELAKDAAQEAFVKMWINRDKYDSSKGAFYTWMKTIVWRVALDSTKSRNNVRDRYLTNDVMMGDEMVASSEIVEAPCLDTDTLDLHNHIKSLNPKYAECILLNKINGYSCVEITKILNVPLATVKSRVRIGLRELRKTYLND